MKTRVGIGFYEDVAAGAVADLVLVECADVDAGNEQLEDAAQPVRGHRVGTPVPAVEFADHADPRGIRRPAGKAHAIDAFALLDTAAEYAIGLFQAAFVEQVQIVRADRRRKAVGVVGFEFALRFADPEQHRAHRLIGALPGKHTLRMDAFHGLESSVRAHRNAGGIRPEYAQRPVRADVAQPEHAERIVVAGANQGLQVISYG